MVDSLNTHDLDAGAEPAEHTKAMLEKAEQIEKNNNPDRPDWLPEKFASVEAMAQASGILGFVSSGLTAEDGKLFLFAGVDKARFKKPVVPGDQLTLTSEVDTVKRNMWRFNTSASVDGKVCCEATLLCAYQDRDKVV